MHKQVARRPRRRQRTDCRRRHRQPPSGPPLTAELTNAAKRSRPSRLGCSGPPPGHPIDVRIFAVYFLFVKYNISCEHGGREGGGRALIPPRSPEVADTANCLTTESLRRDVSNFMTSDLPCDSARGRISGALRRAVNRRIYVTDASSSRCCWNSAGGDWRRQDYSGAQTVLQSQGPIQL